MKNEKKFCKIISDKKAKILINKAKIATKEILRECEETLETMNEVVDAGVYFVKLSCNQRNSQAEE